jgi:hypothetical protein
MFRGVSDKYTPKVANGLKSRLQAGLAPMDRRLKAELQTEQIFF